MAVVARRHEAAAGATRGAEIEIRAGAERLTARFSGPIPELLDGPARHPQSIVQTDGETWNRVLRGDSGLQAFLDGRLTVRGNLSLALQLDALSGRATSRQRHFHAGRVTAGGIDSFYLEAGRGRPVVVLHGLGATNASVLPTFWHLAATRKVIAPDLPGHGDTAKPIVAYSAEFYAQWLCSFLDAMELDEVDLVGHSMGGRVALESGFCARDRIRGLVLLTPSTPFLRHRQYAPLVRLLRPELAVFPPVVLRRHVMAMIRALFADPTCLPEPWFEAATDEFLRVFRTPRGRIAFFSALRQIYLDPAFGPDGFWERLADLAPRTLFIWGSRDWLVPPGFARHVTRRLPNASSVVLRGCGHVPQYERPEATQKLIGEFLAAV